MMTGLEKGRACRTPQRGLQRLPLVFPEFGQFPVEDARPAHVRAALARGLATGKARSTVAKIKIGVSMVLAEL
jgi:hypothetical protein